MELFVQFFICTSCSNNQHCILYLFPMVLIVNSNYILQQHKPVYLYSGGVLFGHTWPTSGQITPTKFIARLICTLHALHLPRAKAHIWKMWCTNQPSLWLTHYFSLINVIHWSVVFWFVTRSVLVGGYQFISTTKCCNILKFILMNPANRF